MAIVQFQILLFNSLSSILNIGAKLVFFQVKTLHHSINLLHHLVV